MTPVLISVRQSYSNPVHTVVVVCYTGDIMILNCFAVECHNCGCVGPRISYDSAERLGLPVEIRYDELADLDGKLLDFAIEAWNQREHQ